VEECDSFPDAVIVFVYAQHLLEHPLSPTLENCGARD
jgi:hypothetical protein